MATDDERQLTRFSPFWTQRDAPGEAAFRKIVDRNLAAIAAAINNAVLFVTRLSRNVTNIDNSLSINIAAGSAGRDGTDGQDALDAFPAPVAAPAIGGAGQAAGRPGMDGVDGLDAFDAMEPRRVTGMPRAALAQEESATGDVLTTLDADSRIRAQYCRVVAGPYNISDPAVLYIEDGAVLAVVA